MSTPPGTSPTPSAPAALPTTPTVTISALNLTVKCLTWNIEGMKRNIFGLKHFLDIEKPQLVFLSEPQLFSFELNYCLKYLQGDYCCALNSEDKGDPELSLIHNKAKGGTMLLRRKDVTPTSQSALSLYPASFQSSSALLEHQSPYIYHCTFKHGERMWSLLNNWPISIFSFRKC